VKRNLVTHGGWLDNVIWVVNTKDEADLAYLDKILARSPLYKTHILPEQVGWPDYAKIWRMVNRETMYIKIDDDIVRPTNNISDVASFTDRCDRFGLLMIPLSVW
jgi:hypothetical protein